MRSLSPTVVTCATAALAAAAGFLAAAFVADRWAVWDGWRSANVAVALWSLVGLVGGAVVGVVIARHHGPAAGHGFVRSSAAAVGAVLLPPALLHALGRLSEDPTPTLGGEALHLRVELRWPAAQVGPPAAVEGGAGRVRYARVHPVLGTTGTESAGLLWLEDARRGDDGRWTAPGAAPIHSAQASRPVLTVVLDPARPEATAHRFPIALAGRPADADRTWSAWVDAADGYGVRYRVVPRSAALRTERVGAATVETVVRDFLPTWAPAGGVLPDGPGRLRANGERVVRVGGRVVRRDPLE